MRVEVRADKSVHIHGYVNVVGRDSRVLRDKSGPYIEQVAPGAFARALKEGGAVELRFNHRRSLGATGDNLELREDDVGLLADAVITDEEVAGKAERRELRGWSFGFVKKKDTWKTDGDGTRRRTLEDLELREVSILDKTPAYIATSIETREEGEVLVEFRMEEPVEPEYIRQSVTETQTQTKTLSQGEKTEMDIVSKTIEIYKMKRRNA